MRMLWLPLCLVAAGCAQRAAATAPAEADAFRLGHAHPSVPADRVTFPAEPEAGAQEQASPAETGAVATAAPQGRAPAVDPVLSDRGLVVDCTVLDYDADGNEVRKDAPPCERAADLDGDGGRDSIRFVREEATGRRGFLVVLATGEVQVLGAGQLVTIGSSDPETEALVDDDYSWFMDWAIAHRSGSSFEVRTGARTRRVPGSRKAKGDGLMISGGDAAAVIYHDGTQYRISHLGF